MSPYNAVVLRQEAGPYTVPAGKLLAITGFGTTYVYESQLFVDGVMEARSYKNGEDMAKLPGPLPVAAGSVVTVTAGNGMGRVYGHLLDI